jgi:hypothetical protein
LLAKDEATVHEVPAPNPLPVKIVTAVAGLVDAPREGRTESPWPPASSIAKDRTRLQQPCCVWRGVSRDHLKVARDGNLRHGARSGLGRLEMPEQIVGGVWPQAAAISRLTR